MMLDLLRSEWIKLRSVTMNLVIGIVAVAFPLTVSLLTAYFNGDNVDFTTRDFVGVLTGTAVICALLCGVVAATSITSEFGFGTIRPTFVATPARLRVVLAKGMVVIGATAVMATIVQLIGWFVGGAIARGRGATIVLGDVPTAVPAMVGAIVLTALMALGGYGFGLITRSTPVAISILIVWPLIAEGLVGAVLRLITDNENIINWMPFQAGIRLAFVDIGGADGPSRLVAGLYFGGVAALLVAVGGWAVDRRDA